MEDAVERCNSLGFECVGFVHTDENSVYFKDLFGIPKAASYADILLKKSFRRRFVKGKLLKKELNWVLLIQIFIAKNIN